MKLKLEKALEPGKYEAVVTRFEEVEGKFGTAAKFIYETDDGQEINELVKLKYTAKTKLGKRVQEILGNMPEHIELTDLIGKRVVITLVHNDDNPDFPKVSSVQKA